MRVILNAALFLAAAGAAFAQRSKPVTVEIKNVQGQVVGTGVLRSQGS
jgi:hypothetical protein